MDIWEVAHVGVEGDEFALGGLHVWKQEWRRSPRAAVELPSPDYPSEIKTFIIFEIGNHVQPIQFAAIEVSNGVFAFYVERPISVVT